MKEKAGSQAKSKKAKREKNSDARCDEPLFLQFLVPVFDILFLTIKDE